MTGLTPAEHKAMDLTAQLWNLMVTEIIADGPTAEQDRREFAAKIHTVQHNILRQAAARAHPEMYRLLGESFTPRSDDPERCDRTRDCPARTHAQHCRSLGPFGYTSVDQIPGAV